MALIWLLPLLGTLLGSVILLGAFTTANGAPQEAAGAALASACAILPYVFARSIEGIRGPQATRPAVGGVAPTSSPTASPTPSAPPIVATRARPRDFLVPGGVAGVILVLLALFGWYAATSTPIRGRFSPAAPLPKVTTKAPVVIWQDITRERRSCDVPAGTRLDLADDHDDRLHVKSGDVCEGWIDRGEVAFD